jgi:hypothetical protein
MLLSFRHRPIPSILICGHEWGTMQPNMPLTNIRGLDLDMAMLDFKPSIVPVLHAYSTSVALYEDTCSILWVSDYLMLWR